MSEFNEKEEIRVEQLGIDVILPKGITMEEVIKKMTIEFENLGVEVCGFMTTDTSWSWREYCGYM